ncbi:MAG: cysteine desulfurase [Candidatus Dojkabacteria bacterium]|nr:MAG: cysteine desulfurase [Candidatus Dojkabacteria bacterium]
MAFDIETIRKQFPILNTSVNGRQLIYFDNAATTQKPKVMIDTLVDFYSNYNANIHRGIHSLANKATEAYEKTRQLIAQIYKVKPQQIIFTKNDTESINLIIQSLGKQILKNKKSNIVITEVEHHSNIVPWHLLRHEIDFEIRYLEFDENGILETDSLSRVIDRDTQFLSFTWASNTFGLIYDAKKIIRIARQLNPNIIVLVDAAQYVPHSIFDFQEIDADFITFSAHKMCGPTGVGILIGKKNLLEQMQPFLGGGDMIKEVSKYRTTFNDLPYKFEAGTPNIADVIAFGASLRYLLEIGFENIQAYEQELAQYLIDKIQELDFVDIYGTTHDTSRVIKLPILSFNVRGVHAHDVGHLLDEDGIAVRAGHHCTQLIMQKLRIPATVRASLYFYNTKSEIDAFIHSLKKIYDIFK